MHPDHEADGDDGVTCARVLPLLAGLTGGELEATRSSLVRAHLRHCLPCRREASSLLRAGRVLREAVAARDAGVADEALQVDLHAAIMAKVAEIEWREVEPHEVSAAFGPGVLGFARWRRVAMPWRHFAALASAAVLLIAMGFWGFGCWLGDDNGRVSIWDRQPLQATGSGPVRVVPYAGPRVELQPVGLTVDELDSAERRVGPGMMGRGRLRSQFDEELSLPVLRSSPR